MLDYSRVKVGDTVWFTGDNQKGLTEAVVVKVGPKLIHVSGPRVMSFRKETGCINDRLAHNQTLITDFVAYGEYNAACKVLQRLYCAMSWRPQAGVTVGDIEAAAKLLKLDVSDPC